MKNKIIFSTLIILAFAASAQDTVRYPDRWYGYTPREALMEYVGLEPSLDIDGPNERGLKTAVYINCQNPPYFASGIIPEMLLSLMRFVDSGANQKMYGIAVTMRMDPNLLDTLSGRLVVYQGVHMTPEPSFMWQGVNRPHIYIGSVDSILLSIPINDPPLMKKCVFEYDYSLPTVWSLYSDCYEFYFDEPVDLSTTNTCIGITQCGFYLDSLNLGRDTSRSQAWYAASHTNDPKDPMRFTNLLAHSITMQSGGKYKDYYELPGYENKYWQDSYWGMIFPILSPRCTAPKCLHIVSGGEWQDTAVWCGDQESEVFQLSLAGYHDSPDSGTIVTITDTSYLLPRELPDSVCVAYVRKMCTFEFASHTDTVWGDWSAPVLVACDTNGLGTDDSLSIARADLQHSITLTPNPATERVTVSATGMQSVELLAVDGTVIMRREGLHQDDYPLDLKGLAAGLYMVRVGTPLGTATRRLLVQ